VRVRLRFIAVVVLLCGLLLSFSACHESIVREPQTVTSDSTEASATAASEATPPTAPTSAEREASVYEVIPLMYDYVSDFSEGLAAVCLDERWGYINKDGEVVIPFQYTFATSFSEGVAWVSLTEEAVNGSNLGVFGLIDMQGNQILPFEYYLASNWSGFSRFSDGLALVRASEGFYDGYVFIDKTGKTIVSGFDWGFTFSEGFAAVGGYGDSESSMKYSFIDKTGRFISGETDPIAYFVFQDDGLRLYFSEGLAPFKKGGKFGFINTDGETVIPFIYDYVQGFSEGLSLFRNDGGYGYVDKNGKEVLVFDKDERTVRGAFSDGLASVFKRGEFTEETYTVTEEAHKVGYINKSGELVIPYTYTPDWGHGTTAKEFSEGFAAVKSGQSYGWVHKYGFIDTQGNEVVPLIYDEARSFSEGMAAVRVGGWISEEERTEEKWGFISIKN
jgi:hypothetical protein